MADSVSNDTEEVTEDLKETLQDIEYTGRKHNSKTAAVIGGIAALWSIYQLWIASPFPYQFNFLIISDVPARAIHLAFGLVLVYLVFPASRKSASSGIPIPDLILSLLGGIVTLYLFFAWDYIAMRPGMLLEVDLAGFKVPLEVIVGWCGILLLLEATRRQHRLAAGHRCLAVHRLFDLRPVDAGRHFAPRRLGVPSGRLPLVHRRGHLRHPDRGDDQLRVSVRAVRCHPRQGRRRALLPEPRLRHGRQVSRRSGQGLDPRLGHDRADLRLVDRQRGDHRYIHHPG